MYNKNLDKMTQEQLRMQMLAGIITEGQYKAKLNEIMIPIINRPSSRQTVQPNKISTKLSKPSSSLPSPSVNNPEKQNPTLNSGEFLVTYRDKDFIKFKKIIKSPDLKSVEKIFWDEMGPNTMGKYVIIDIQ